MKRAQRLKEAWQKFRNSQDNEGRSYLNLGRWPLERYLDYSYKQYLDYCYLEQTEPKPFMQYLFDD